MMLHACSLTVVDRTRGHKVIQHDAEGAALIG